MSRLPVLAAVLVALMAPAAAHAARCATASSPPPRPIPVATETLRAARRGQPAVRELGTFQIVLVEGPALLANADAAAAFRRAADQWEAVIADPITVTINADLAPLADPDVIGQASTLALSGSYTDIRDATVADAALEADDGVAASLPAAGAFGAFLPGGVSLGGDLVHTKAGLKALGFTGLDSMFGAADAEITFNSNFAFDFDNRDGVGPGLIDFETTAAHEIGHALGFFSAVDDVDAGSATIVRPAVLDLYRFPQSASPATAPEFTTFARELTPGFEAVFDDLASELALSTGAFTGDGRQASHWKDDALGGTLIGVMDPTLATQQVVTISAADARALDLAGYDIGMIVTTTTVPGATTTTSTSTTTTTLPAPLSGKKLLLKDNATAPAKRKLVLVSKDPAVANGAGPGSADDPVLGGGGVRVFALGGPGFDGSADYPAAAWRYLKKKKPEKGYVLTGQVPFKKILVKPGRLLKIVGKGDALPQALAEDPGGVAVIVTLGAQRQCLVFGGTATFTPGKKFLAKNALPPAVCPAGPPPPSAARR